MSVFQKVNGYVEHLATQKHDLSSDQLRLAMSNAAPSAETPDPSVLTPDCFLVNVTEIDYAFCSSRDVTVSSAGQVDGLYECKGVDMTLSASGGSVGPFRYVYLYNSVNDALIGFWDYGVGGVTLANGESLDVDFDTDGNVLVDNQ